MRLFLLGLCVALLSYCQPVIALVPSIPDLTSDFPTVVQISASDRDNEGEIVNAYCVGTFVSPTILLTAAHCLRGAVLLGEQEMKIRSGYYKYRIDPNGQNRVIGFLPVHEGVFSFQVEFAGDLKKQIIQKKWRSEIQVSQDLAIVKLGTPFPWPEGQKFAKVPTGFSLSSLKIADYLPTTVTINPIAEIRSIDYKRKSQLDNIAYSSRGYWQSRSLSRVEPGDSGAPLFMKSGLDWYFVGVTKGRGENLFSNWDVFVLLDQKACQTSQAFSDREIQKYFCP